MATNEQLDRLISGWLEEAAPARIPEHVFSTTFERSRRSRQQRSWRAFLGRLNMPRFAPAMSAAAVVVLAAALAVNLFFNQQGRIGAASPSPRHSESPIPTAQPT